MKLSCMRVIDDFDSQACDTHNVRELAGILMARLFLQPTPSKHVLAVVSVFEIDLQCIEQLGEGVFSDNMVYWEEKQVVIHVKL